MNTTNLYTVLVVFTYTALVVPNDLNGITTTI